MGIKSFDDVDLAFDRITLRASALPPPLPAKRASSHPPSRGEPGTRWHLSLGSGIVPGISVGEIRERWEQGDLTPDSFVWRPGLPGWVRLSTVAELREAIAPRPSLRDANVMEQILAAPLPVEDQAGEEWKPTASQQMHRLLRGASEADPRIALRLRLQLTRSARTPASVRGARAVRGLVFRKRSPR